MKFGTHDFHHNFCNASGANNGMVKKRMVIDELTKVMADNRIGVIQAMKACGISISDRAGLKETVRVFLNNLSNRTLQKNVSILILKNNDLKEDTKVTLHKDAMEMLNASGDSASMFKFTEKPMAGEIEDTLNNMAESFKSDTSNKLKKEIEKDILDSIHDPTALTGSQIAGRFLAIAFIATVAGIAISKLYKHYKNKK